MENVETDQESSAGEQIYEDVKLEQKRIQQLVIGPPQNCDAVMIKEIHKVPFVRNVSPYSGKCLLMIFSQISIALSPHAPHCYILIFKSITYYSGNNCLAIWFNFIHSFFIINC